MAHFDDEVLTCASALSRMAREKNLSEIDIVIFSKGRKESDVLSEMKGVQELMVNHLKVSVNYHLLEYEDQEFDKHPQLKFNEVVEKMMFMVDPDIIVTHWAWDLNKDHRIVNEAVKVATRRVKRTTSIFEAFTISSTHNALKPFEPNTFMQVSKEDVEFKVKCMQKYVSELDVSRSRHTIVTSMEYFGSMIGVEYAEPFYVRRVIDLLK